MRKHDSTHMAPYFKKYPLITRFFGVLILLFWPLLIVIEGVRCVLMEERTWEAFYEVLKATFLPWEDRDG